MKVTDGVRQIIQQYIGLLDQVLPKNPQTINDYELKDWIPNCIECLEWAIKTDKDIPEQPYNDLLSTLYLLYECFVKSEEWAYIELRQKFKTIYSGEQIGRALKVFTERIKEANREDETKKTDYVSFTDTNGNFKSVEQILDECANKWNELS